MVKEKISKRDTLVGCRLTWSEIWKGFRQIPLAYRFGFLLSLLYFSVFVIITSYFVLMPGHPRWTLAWGILVFLDLPFSLFLFFCLPLCPTVSFPFLIYPLSDLKNFWLPFFYFGVSGTAWYLYLPLVLSRVAGKHKKEASQ